MDLSYFDYVKYLSRDRPDLRPLSGFLAGPCQQPDVEEVECHVASLEFRNDGTTRYSRIGTDELNIRLQDSSQKTRPQVASDFVFL